MAEQWWRKCRDCGMPMDPAKPTKSRRYNVCDGCMDNRLRLVKARESGAITPDQFGAAQRKLQIGRGAAKRFLVTLLGEEET